jgi:SPP1 gp7 family putative phage head morphogenesis protein
MLFIYPYPKDGNFYGESDFSEIYEQWRAKKQIFRFRNIHLQNYGSPIPIVTYDKERCTPTEINNVEDMLDNWQDQYYIMQPGNWNEDKGEIVGKFQFDFREMKQGQATSQYEDAIDQIDKQITRNFLIPDKVGFSESPGGSYNQAEVQNDILASVIKYMHSWLETPVNDLIKQIVDLNYLDVEEYPRFEFDEINDDIGDNILQILFNNGVIDKREKWIRTKFSIPQLSEKEKEEIEKEKEKEAPLMPPKDDSNSSPKKNDDNEEEDDDDDKVEPEDEKMKAHFKSEEGYFKADKVEKVLDKKEDQFIDGYTDLHKFNSDRLVKQVESKKIIEKKDLKLVDTLRIDKTKLKNYYSQRFAESYFFGKVNGITEVKPRLKKAIKFKTKDAKKIKKDSSEYQEGFFISTTQQQAHWHNAIIDENGQGRTTGTMSMNGVEADHVHEIKDYEVLPTIDGGHDHEIQGMASLKAINLQTEVDWLDRAFIDRILEEHGDLGEITEEDKEALKQIRDSGFSLSGVDEDRMVKEVRNVIDQGLRAGTPANTIITQIESALAADRKKYATTIARTNISDHYNVGRMNFFTNSTMRKLVEAYEYMAIMDTNTTRFCGSHDGQIIKASDPRIGTLTPPNHFNCRSTFSPVLVGENEDPDSFYHNYEETFEQWGQGVQKDALNPSKGFGGV